jgi:hypothetical protein
MILPGFYGFDHTEITKLSLSLQKFLHMKHFKKFLTPYSTKLKLTLNPEGAHQGALFCEDLRGAFEIGVL